MQVLENEYESENMSYKVHLYYIFQLGKHIYTGTVYTTLKLSNFTHNLISSVPEALLISIPQQHQRDATYS